MCVYKYHQMYSFIPNTAIRLVWSHAMQLSHLLVWVTHMIIVWKRTRAKTDSYRLSSLLKWPFQRMLQRFLLQRWNTSCRLDNNFVRVLRLYPFSLCLLIFAFHFVPFLAICLVIYFNWFSEIVWNLRSECMQNENQWMEIDRKKLLHFFKLNHWSENNTSKFKYMKTMKYLV